MANQDWFTIKVNSNKVQHDTGKMTLVKLNDGKEGVWIPSKCCRYTGKNGYLLEISLNKNFEYMISTTKEKVPAKKVAEWLGRPLSEEE